LAYSPTRAGGWPSSAQGGAQLLTGTTVTRIERGRAETTAGEIEAGTFVLCAGALAMTRLLLASGIRHDALGRCFQDHAEYYAPRVVAGNTRALQNRWKVLGDGCLATFVFDYGENDPLNAAFRLRRRVDRRDLGLAVPWSAELASAAFRLTRDRMPAPRPQRCVATCSGRWCRCRPTQSLHSSQAGA
jgi:glycine/D-amino acid oxidase-like deaminating enzyme